MTDQTSNPSISSPTDTKAPSQATARVVGDASRVTIGGGEEYTDRNLAFSSNQTAATAPTQDIVSTIRSPMGRPLSGSEVRPNSVITVHGMETTVAAAMAAGFLRQNSMGHYEDPNAPARAAAPETAAKSDQKALEEALKADREQAAKSSTPEATAIPDLAPEFHGYAEQFIAGVDDMTRASVVRSLIEGKDIMKHDLEQVAGQLGIKSEEVQRRIDGTYQAFVDQAVSLAGPAGYDALMWARDNEPGLLKEAATQHVYHSNPAAYDRVVNTYALKVVDTDPQRILTSPVAQQYGIRRESDGRITVQHPTAGRIEWKAGIRAGLLNIGQR